ncbi:LysR family transcriptional regulator [Pseudomonas aeruginosa]|nr:LysR family transcriptional regulator [Pseudomonas aeruginosa]
MRHAPSAVSKLITRLEQRLGTRLLNRSTRQRCNRDTRGMRVLRARVRILADLERPSGVRAKTRAAWALASQRQRAFPGITPAAAGARVPRAASPRRR